MLPTVYLAAEDVPGLAVGRKLVAEYPALSVYREENARGYGSLKIKTPNYDQMGANGLTPVGRAAIGPDYNELLSNFIAENWSIERAIAHALSLARARQRIAELAASCAA